MRQMILGTIMKLMLWQLIFVATTESYKSSSTLSSKHLVRHKRDNSPEILKIKYRYGNELKLVVLRKVVDTTLVSSRVPIWNIEVDEDESNKYYIRNIDPVFYHGVATHSAVTYFPRTNTLHGVMDYRFYLENLPLNDAENPDIVAKFAHRMSRNFLNNRRPRRSNDKTQQTKDKRKLEKDTDFPPVKRFKDENEKYNTRKILYPEILITVDVSSRVDADPDYRTAYEKAIMYTISYWNAVDMLFRQLRRVDIRINIAGIFIGKTDNLISSVAGTYDYRVDEHSRIFLKKEDALNGAGHYFAGHPEISRDSFDFLVWMTRAILTDEHNKHEQRRDLGIATPPANCGGMHEDELEVNGKITNRAVIMHDDKYADYQIAARQLAHLMFVATDDIEVSHNSNAANCLPTNPLTLSSGIMDPDNKRVEGCLMWSYCSEIHFENYAKSQASCCLLNYPFRTMGRPNVVIPLTAERQCQCYGMTTNPHVNYDRFFCHEPLICRNENGQHRKIAWRLDGTPCEIGQFHGFCNDRVCLE